MVAISQPQTDIFSAETFTLDDILATSTLVNSSERNQIAFAARTDELINSGSKNYLLTGAALAILGKHDQAIENLEKASDSKEKFLELAFCLRKTCQYDKAIEAVDKAAKAGADNLQVNCTKAIIRTLKKDFAEAEKALKACENYKGQSAVYHYTLGRYLQSQGQYDEAIESYQVAVGIDPVYSKALFHLAFLLDIRGDDHAAMEYYKQLINNGTAYVSAILNLSVLYEDAEQYDKAAKCIEQVLKFHPNNQRAILFRRDVKSSETMLYDEEIEKTKDQRNRILETPISDFELSVRSRNCLKKMNIHTLGDLLRITEAELLAYKNFGETSLTEIKKMLESKNLRLGMVADGKMMPLTMQDMQEPASDVDPELLKRSLDEFEMSVRSRKCLEHLNMKTIGELAAKTEAELLGVKNFGMTSLTEMKQILESVGLDLRKLD